MESELELTGASTPEEIDALREAAISNIQGNLAYWMEVTDPFSPIYAELAELRASVDDLAREVYGWESH